MIYRTNAVFQGITLPGVSRTVEFRTGPISVRLGFLASGLFLWCSWLFLSLPYRQTMVGSTMAG